MASQRWAGKDFRQPKDPRTGEPRSKYARGDWDPNDPDYPIVCAQCGNTEPQRFFLFENMYTYTRKIECIKCVVTNDRQRLLDAMHERKLMRAEQRRRKDARERRKLANQVLEERRRYAQKRDKAKGQPQRYRK